MELKKDDIIILDLDSYSGQVKISEIYFVHSPATILELYSDHLGIFAQLSLGSFSLGLVNYSYIR
jgi:hypothetical protein